MSAGIPVMIHLDAHTFRVLEAEAKAKGTRMTKLIEQGLQRTVQPKPRHVHGQIPAPTRGVGERGYRRLDDADWAELKRLRSTGWTVPELAVRYGVSSSTIYYRMRREQHG